MTAPASADPELSRQKLKKCRLQFSKDRLSTILKSDERMCSAFHKFLMKEDYWKGQICQMKSLPDGLV